VAPNQFELAPCYQPANVACDQNQIIMRVLQNVADKFGLVCLLHEKPFDGVNGSGKHNNRSLLTNDGTNLLEIGKTPAEQARFAVLMCCILRAVDLHQDLMRFAVASAANDCRLGGFEAPPQTVSVFLGGVFDILRAATDGNWKPSIDFLPRCNISVDRNRTSPFAFTGNKFEFRTVGSSASIADCNTILNTVFADSIKFFADELEKTCARKDDSGNGVRKTTKSDKVWSAAKELMKKILREHEKIVYNGNNYCDEWKKEADEKGLLNVPDAFCAAKCLSEEKNIRLFEENNVLNKCELEAIQQICWDNYAKTMVLKCNVMTEILKKIAYSLRKYLLTLTQIAKNKSKIRVKFADDKTETEKICKIISQIFELKNLFSKTNEEFRAKENAFLEAKYAAEALRPLTGKARKIANEAEMICPSALWDMPKYGDLLF